MSVPAKHVWTADEVREQLIVESQRWPRYELIDGELLVSPSPGVRHTRAHTWLSTALVFFIAREPIGSLVTSVADPNLREGTVVQPDIFVVPPGMLEHARNWLDVTKLILAIEILSPSTAANDRGIKRRFYQSVGVDEYWIVDLKARAVERWRPGDERPEVLREQLVWAPTGASSPLTLQLAELFDAAGTE